MKFIFAFLLLISATPSMADMATQRPHYKSDIQAVVGIEAPVSLLSTKITGCTGFIVADGYIATAGHCVHTYARPLYITFQDGEEREFKAITHPGPLDSMDVAILKGDTRGIKPMRPVHQVPPLPCPAFNVRAPRGENNFQMIMPCSPFEMLREGVGKGLIAMDCSAVPGDSGGPVILSDNVYIALVVSYSLERPSVSFAVPYQIVEAALRMAKEIK